MSDDLEEWRPVVGWEECYMVSSAGRVRTLARTVTSHTCPGCGLQRSRPVKPAIIKGHVNQRGYLTIRLSRHGRTTAPRPVHQLVCEAFHGPKPPEHEVLHGDGNKLNNCAQNLRWGTKSENAQDRFRHGTAIFGRLVNTNKLSEDDVIEIRASEENQNILAARYNTTYQNIVRIKSRLTWKHI